jgi:hypothetical protein
MGAFQSDCRAIAIGNPEVRRKLLFPGVHVSIDFLKLGIEIGVGGDGKLCQRKHKPITGGLQERFLASPAGEEA